MYQEKPQADVDADFMLQALRLAAQGRGAVEPNPMVGCVIVRDAQVIGAGFHRRFGSAHAEPQALAACPGRTTGATAYVTLEPCCHTNKKTPPCVPALIAAGLRRVVIGCLDPNPPVAGNGVNQLRQAGLAVDVGVLEAQCRQINAPYFAQVQHTRPYVTLKWAQSSDGKVAGAKGRRVWISNQASQRVVHGLRACGDAILVGINTVLADDPLLTARHVELRRPLLRLVLDRDLRLPPTSQLARTTDQGPVIVYGSPQSCHDRADLVSALHAHRVQVQPVPLDASGQLSLPDLLMDLGRRPVTHLIVEPGPTLAASFLTQALADRVWIFRSPTPINQDGAPAAPTLTYPATGDADLDGDRLTEYLNPASPVFFTLRPSADLLREIAQRVQAPS